MEGCTSGSIAKPCGAWRTLVCQGGQTSHGAVRPRRCRPHSCAGSLVITMWQSSAADWGLWLAQVQEADAMLAEQQRVYRDFDALPSMQALTG